MALSPALKEHAGPWLLGGETGCKRDQVRVSPDSLKVDLNKADGGGGGGRRW